MAADMSEILVSVLLSCVCRKPQEVSKSIKVMQKYTHNSKGFEQ